MKTRLHRSEITQHVSQTAPAIRTLIVILTPEENDGKKDFRAAVHPVVAIELRVVESFVTEVPIDPPCGGPLLPRTADEALAEGWKFVGQDTNVGAVYIDDDGFLCSSNESFEWNQRYRFVACNWPANEDEKRLSKIINKMSEDWKFLLITTE